MKSNRNRIGVQLAAALLVVTAFLAACNGTPEPSAGEEELQTAVVRQGDLALFASGSGSLIPGRKDPRFQVHRGDCLATARGFQLCHNGFTPTLR
jgi:hypothetical protein